MEKAVKQAEDVTRCEFVCAVASRSDAYERGIKWWSLLGVVFGLLAANTASQVGHASGDWEYLSSMDFFTALVGSLAGFFLFGLLAHRIPAMLFLFVGEKQKSMAVEKSAAYLFGKHKVSHTEERVGVLIYLSLAERKLVILADRAVKDFLGAKGIAELVAVGGEQLKAGRKDEALIKTLEAAAEKLLDEFPGHEHDVDELANHVLTVHPYP